MKNLLSLTICALTPFAAAPAASTIFTGDAGDTPSTFQFNTAPGPAVVPAGGNPGGYLQVTQAVNGLQNGVGFNNTAVGSVPLSNFAFDFRITAAVLGRFGNSADGFNFSYLPTSAHGATGAPPSMGEDPASAGVLGFGFDTWSNHGGVDLASPDDPAQPQSSNYEEISLFFNGALVQRINDTELLFPALTLDDGLFHRVNGSVNFAAQTVSMTVDGTLIFSNTPVPGLVPFESRVSFGARTGGENEEVAIDNLNVSFIPEPSVATVALLSLGLLARRRRH